jgi:hypothetical protein
MPTFDHTSLQYSPEMGVFQAEEFEWREETEVFDEAELMALAQELLSVTNEAELDMFLGNLIKQASQAVGKVVSSPTGTAVGGWLKGAAKQAVQEGLPAAGGWLGTKIGQGLADAAGWALGGEAETLSAEDQGFEGAKRLARMAGDAVKAAVMAPPSASPPEVAKAAVMAAAQKHAPGLLRAVRRSCSGASRAGRWVRRGDNIVLENC